MGDDTAAKEAAAKQRIISHMNADHHDSVVRYLEHYHKVPGYTAYTGRLTDISLIELQFSCGGRTYRTPFDPPMKSYREARERVVEMDKECVSALGRSDITVNEFIKPYGLYLGLFSLVSVTLVAFSRRANFAPDSALGSLLPSGFRNWCAGIQPWLFWGMILIHGLETLNMARGRLRKHNVNVRNPVYWLWLGDTFIEGVGCYHRFDKFVKQKQMEKERQKH